MIVHKIHHVLKGKVGFFALDITVVEQTPVDNYRNQGKVHGITPKDLPQLLRF